VLPIALLLPLAYLLGTFPSAQLVARSRGVDITAAGSGNPGASNVSRVLGRKEGIVVFALDGAKGAISAAAGYLVAGYAGGLALAIAAILGHIFPVTRRFHGGKGVATACGAMLVLYPVPALCMVVPWLVVIKLTGKASLASLTLVVLFPTTLAVIGRPLGEVLAVVGTALLLLWRHLPNLRRLASGTELDVRRG
jgi:glycerol-3-phosphate acyltransferase PlsY